LGELRNNRNDKNRQLREKFENMDKGAKNINKFMGIYKKTLREQHMFKKMDQEDRHQSLKHGATAYKT